MSINGHTVEVGNATANSTASTGLLPNNAIANGTNANADAGNGAGNSAFALGDNTIAQAENGTGNTARATGAGSQAYAGVSPEGSNNNDNTATATNGGFAWAGGSGPETAFDIMDSNNTATADGAGSYEITPPPPRDRSAERSPATSAPWA